MNQSLLKLDEPIDYFSGIGQNRLPTPTRVLLFLRETKMMLQQEALQNRSHHRFVLCFNLRTEGHVHINNLTLSLNPGQAVLILPYQFHHFSRLATPQLHWLFCTFELEPSTFLETMRNRLIDFSGKTECSMEALLQEWHDPRTELQDQQVQTALLKLLLSLKQDRQQTATDLPPEPKDNLLRAVNCLMAEWRGRTVTVADIAETLGSSGSRLRTHFKEVAGISISDYIQNYRLNRAMALLSTSDLSITDIAEEAGFGSPQAFCRTFKKETGQTPRSYRLNN